MIVKEEITRRITLSMSEEEAKIILVLLGKTSTNAEWTKPINEMYIELRKVISDHYYGADYIEGEIKTKDPKTSELFNKES